MDLKKASFEELEFVVFDTETTGIYTMSAWPVELAGVRVSGTFMTDRVYQSLCRPDVIITPEVTAVHGITDDDVRDSPPPMEVIDSFFEWAGKDAVFVAHNAPFDLGILATAYRRAARRPPQGLIFLDTLEIAHQLLAAPSYGLSTLAKVVAESTSYQVPLIGCVSHDAVGHDRVMSELNCFHRALADSLHTAVVFCFLINMFGSGRSISDLEAQCGSDVTADFPVQLPRMPKGEAGFDMPPNLWQIEQAIEKSSDVMIVYSGGRAGMPARKIRPVSMYGHGGKYYVEAFCYISGFVKTFRLDRISKVWEA